MVLPQDLELFALFSIALFGSFGHCIGMCGGITIAYTSSKIDGSMSKRKSYLAHLLYGSGRVTVYTAFGAIFGAIGSVFVFDRYAIATLYLVASAFMILAGLSLLGKIRFLSSVEHSISSVPLYKRIFLKLLSSKSLPSFYLLGLLNGFLPCGFVYFFAIAAATSASVSQGALIMFIFGIATIPALFLVGVLSGTLMNSRFREFMLKIASLLVIGFGIFTLFSAYNFYTNPNASLTNCH